MIISSLLPFGGGVLREETKFYQYVPTGNISESLMPCAWLYHILSEMRKKNSTWCDHVKWYWK
jgi:hypothetical protein